MLFYYYDVHSWLCLSFLVNPEILPRFNKIVEPLFFSTISSVCSQMSTTFTDKSRYFGITEFNNGYIIRSPTVFLRVCVWESQAGGETAQITEFNRFPPPSG